MYKYSVLFGLFSRFWELQDENKTQGLYDVSVIEMPSSRNVGCALIPLITKLNLVHNTLKLVLIICYYGAF